MMLARCMKRAIWLSVAATALASSPVISAAADLAEGKVLYDQMCSGCHGFKGDGGEGHRGGFSPHIGTLANKEYMASVGDDWLMLIIQKGGAAVGKIATMPAWEKRLSETEIRSIIAHIRTF